MKASFSKRRNSLIATLRSFEYCTIFTSWRSSSEVAFEMLLIPEKPAAPRATTSSTTTPNPALSSLLLADV